MPQHHIPSAVVTQFQFFIVATLTFLVVLAFSARKRWLTSRELTYGGAAVIIVAAVYLGYLALLMAAQNYAAGWLQAAAAIVITAPFIFSVSMALYFLVKRAKRDEATAAAKSDADSAAAAAAAAAKAGRKRRRPAGKRR